LTGADERRVDEPLRSTVRETRAGRLFVGSLVAQIPTTVKIWSLTAALAMAAVGLYLLFLQNAPAPVPAFDLPWPLVAAGVAIAELRVVEVHFRRESHAFSLSEFPAVVGMFFLPVNEYLVAVGLGAGIALAFGAKQPMLKIGFNLANYLLMAVISLSILHGFAALNGAPHLRDWIVAFAATQTAAALTAVTIATVITVSGGAPQLEKLPEMIRFGSLVAFANTSLGLLAVSILWLDPTLVWLLALPLVIIFLSYRAYVSEKEKHERLEMLYESSRILQHSPELDVSLAALLGHARTMFRAELAEVVLYGRRPTDDALRTRSWHDGTEELMTPVREIESDALHERIRASSAPFFWVPPTGNPARIRQAMVSSLRGESDVLGSLIIANRLTEGTSFNDDDLRLFETLANQAASALENGHLEQSLAELSRLKEQLRYQAYHDPLTGLANRSLFLERVTSRIENPSLTHDAVVLFLDLDDFKIVNDTQGHAAGDQLLSQVGDRLTGTLREEDVVARLGGDEFGVLLNAERDVQDSLVVANRIIDTLQANFQIQGQEVKIGASIGLAVARLGTETADELLRNADVAMYTAKASGKNRVAVFEPMMHRQIVARHALSAELAASLARGELAVYYQPIIDLATGVAVGVEALVRWQHPTRGLVEPSEFVPLAEETGVILPIGAWVLEEACTQVARWSGFGRRGMGVSLTVNLSAQQLAEATFVDDLRRILAVAGLPPERLILEMTETVMFHDTATTLSRLQDIRDLGVRIAIDDFGTGYSSLGYLRRFRVDLLKIAREFVGSADRQEDWAFAGAIVALGRTLGLSIIAEGIEEQGQLERLRALGCEFGQGFLFARPQTGEVTERYLATRTEVRAPVPAATTRRSAAGRIAKGLQTRVAV
jgi:diguanylate cyclase (GGDEF)-like protein